MKGTDLDLLLALVS